MNESFGEQSSLNGAAEQFGFAADLTGAAATAAVATAAKNEILSSPTATDAECLAAQLAADRADLAEIQALGADSKITHELGIITDGQ